MNGGAPARPALRLLPDEPGQVPRLARFREQHPDVIIGDGGFGTWQALIPEETGETVTTRYTLRELLDKLDELTTGRGGGPARDLPILATLTPGVAPDGRGSGPAMASGRR